MKKHFTLLAVLTLVLTGCTGNKTSDSTSKTPSAPQVSEVSEVPATSAKPSETPTEAPSESASASAEPSETVSSAPTISLWGKNIEEERKKYLGGSVLPYTNIGTNKSLATGLHDSRSKTGLYYEIIGSSTFDGARFNAEFKAAYEQDGFTVTIDPENTYRTAVKDSAHLSVTIKQDEQDEGVFTIRAKYDEPFDSTKKNAWTADEEAALKGYLYNHTIPFVYLGTANPYFYQTYDQKELWIYGWNYDASIRTAATAAFKSEDGWSASVVNEDGKDKFTAVKTFDDCKLSVEIDEIDNNATTRARMSVTKDDIWNPDSAPDNWDTDRLDEIHDSIDNHDIPYVYLGAAEPKREYKDDTHRFTFTGGFWNAEVIALAKASFEAAGWTVNEYRATYGQAINATIQEEDGCRLSMVIEPPYSATGKITRYVTCSAARTIPADATTWDDDTKAARTSHFNGLTIPYFFIGAKDTRASFSYLSSSVQITPALSGTYNVQMLYGAESALVADGYAVTKKYKSTYAAFDLSATKTFDNGDQLIVTRKANDTKDSLPGTAYVNVRYLEKYDETYEGSYADGTDTKSEKTTTAASRTSCFGASHSVPYFYLGAKHFYSQVSSDGRSITITGGRWNDAILSSRKTKITADTSDDATWGSGSEVKDSSGLITYTNTKTFKDGSTIQLTLTQPKADTADEPFHPTTRTFLYNEAYGSSDTDWEDATKNVRTTNLGGYTIPYIYLHAASDKVTSSKSVDSNNAYHYVTLTGGIWDDRILPNAETTLKADGYSTDTSTLRNQHESLEAYKKNTNGSYLRVLLYKDGTNNKTAKARLVIYYDAALTITDTQTDWSDDLKNVYSGKLYNSVPYFYRGEYLTAKRTENDNQSKTYLTIQTDKKKQADGQYHYLNNNINYIVNAKGAFEKAGWTIEKRYWLNSATNGSYGYTSFIAQIKNANGSVTRAKVVADRQNIKMDVYSYGSYQLPEEANQKWNDDDIAIMENVFYGNVAPYVYLGSDHPHWSSNSSLGHKIEREGGLWNDKVFEDAINTFTNDTSIKWSYRYSHSTLGSETITILYASGEVTNSDGSKSYWEYTISPKNEGFTKVIYCTIVFYK